jgi:hypothetical protein
MVHRKNPAATRLLQAWLTATLISSIAIGGMMDAIRIIVDTVVRFALSRALAIGLFLATVTLAPGITLSWNANTESNIAGYHLYYGTADAPYSSTLDVSGTTATVSGLQNGATYTFAVTAYDTTGAESAYSVPASYTAGSAQVIPSAILANISTRSNVKTGDQVMIGGFIVDGVVAKKLALRALGPSLSSAGIVGAMPDPVLQVLDSKGAVVAQNDNWNVTGEQIASYGLAPNDSREAALVVSLLPGAYSAIVSGQGNSGGVALFELYDLSANFGRAANISTRSQVGTGDQVMIGGFIIGGTTGSKVMVRAIGPSLTARGVADALKNPSLDLYDRNGILIGSNDSWRSNQEADIIASTLAPTDDRESAIIATLVPGAYSAIVSGANGSSGVALVEVYALN